MSPTPVFTASPIDRLGALILVEEISHRVCNEYTQAIASIRLAAADSPTEEARQALTDAATKLKKFADAHRALQAPHARGSIDLGEHLARVCAANMAAALEGQGVRINLSCFAIELSPERCWRIALVVAELVANSARHGLRNGPGNIAIELGESANSITCRVSDDGAADASTPPGRGLSVLKALAADLDGEIIWQFRSTGTTSILTIPKDLKRL